MIEHDGDAHAEEILARCRRTLRMWRGVYNTLGVEFQYKEPSTLEMQQAIRIEALRYKDKPDKKD